ncbi:MAG: thioredoxin-disulfide reductase [Bacilli bacterium]|jgi:thioredoxin reductase (NADPH)|nr:thioredoxin-disulfide reductase [Bacilli bacterium]
MENKLYDIIIIGAGPAGMTCAIYARRANLETLVLEAQSPGGKMVKTAEIENWPGIKNTSGPDLAFAMFDQMNALKPEFVMGNVAKIINGDIKSVITTEGNEYKGKAVVIATGMVERKLGIPGEEKYTGHGVSYCAVCDGALFKDKVVTVIGGGNAALDEAIYLSKFASKINIVIRRDVFRADEIEQDEISNNPKINVIVKHVPVEVKGDNAVTSLVIKNVETEELTELPTDGLFPFIGSEPITNFANSLGITNEKGYIEVDEDMATKLAGIYGAGDVVEKKLRQIVTATSDGAIAAQQVLKYININKSKFQ